MKENNILVVGTAVIEGYEFKRLFSPKKPHRNARSKVCDTPIYTISPYPLDQNSRYIDYITQVWPYRLRSETHDLSLNLKPYASGSPDLTLTHFFPWIL